MNSLNALLKAAHAASGSEKPLDEWIEEQKPKPKQNKYELTDEVREFDGHTLYRILILEDHRKGHWNRNGKHLGGWIESEDNLSQDGSCLVYNNAKVYGNARVEQEAEVNGSATICGDAVITGCAVVDSNACVSDAAYIGENATVCDDAQVFGHARVIGEAQVYESAKVSGNAVVTGRARIFGEATVCDNSFISGFAIVSGKARLLEGSTVHSDMCIEGGEKRDSNIRYSSNNLPPENINELEYGVDKYTPDGILIPRCSKENKKYIFTENYTELYDTERFGPEKIRVFQIQRISDGAFGGYIQSEDNLSYNDNCWLTDSYIFGNAHVCENATISDWCWVYGNAYIHGNAVLNHYVRVHGNAELYDYAIISSNSEIYGSAKVYGNATIAGNVTVFDNAEVYDDAIVSAGSIICDNAKVCANAKVRTYEHRIYGNAIVRGEITVESVGGDTVVD